jgi:hypothetical protein
MYAFIDFTTSRDVVYTAHRTHSLCLAILPHSQRVAAVDAIYNAKRFVPDPENAIRLGLLNLRTQYEIQTVAPGDLKEVDMRTYQNAMRSHALA